MGLADAMEHDERYDRADEFMEVVHGHWDSWDDGALIVDQASGRFAHADKVARIDHVGRYFRSRGPFTVPRTQQGHPLVIQAGQSGRGRRFAARWAELVFASYPNLPAAQKGYVELKAEAAGFGREENAPLIATLVHPVVAETKAEAEDKRAAIEKLPLEVDSLMLLSEALNFDFGSKGLDEPLTDAELASMSGTQSMRDRVVTTSGKKNPTVRDFIRFTGRGRLPMPWVGGPKEVADLFEQWFVEKGCDGFVVGAACVPGSYEDFVRFVVPELQRRAVFHRDYRGATLRENLGLERPPVGNWRAGAARTH
jgi:FMN-dependent oxidoreductase (nitrilotriacetate monooxygenase family)